MFWLLIPAVLLLLACIPLGVGGVYDSSGPTAWLILGPVHRTLYPRPPKTKKSKDKEKKKPASTDSGNNSAKKQGGSFKDFYPLLDKVLELLYTFKRKVRVNILELHVMLGGTDPADLAVNYGRAWAGVGNLMPHLERFLTIRKRDVQIQCDFTADTTRIYARADVTITLGRLLLLIGKHGFRILREYLKIMKLRKGGANT